jgi:hypothetical protein
MKQKIKHISLNNIPIYEHLKHYIKKTTYTHRLQWLQEVNDFARQIQKKRQSK